MQQQQKKDFVDSFYPKVNHEKNVAFMEKNKLLPITSSITSESFSLPGSTLLWTTYSSLLDHRARLANAQPGGLTHLWT